MAARSYSQIVQPTTDNTHAIEISPVQRNQYCVLAFFQDQALSTPAVPTGGTITIMAKPENSNVFISTPDGTVDVTNSEDYLTDFAGPTIEAQVALSGVTGGSVAWFTATFIGYDN